MHNIKLEERDEDEEGAWPPRASFETAHPGGAND